MAEYQEVLKQYKRMCKNNHSNCIHCPIDSFRGAYYCGRWITDNPEIAEQIIMTWANDHPMKSNRDKFKEVFGFDPYSKDVFEKVWFEDEYKEPKDE